MGWSLPTQSTKASKNEIELEREATEFIQLLQASNASQIQTKSYASTRHDQLLQDKLYEDLHATTHAFPNLGLNVVDGVRTLSLKGDGLAGAA